MNEHLKLMFGVEAKVRLTSSSLPDEIISKISTEDDLKDSTNTGFRNPYLTFRFIFCKLQ
jgi:hypothetical protein